MTLLSPVTALYSIIIKKSRNLKDSLRTGILRKLTTEEYEKTMELQYARERKELLREQKNKPSYNKVESEDGNEFLADTFEVDKPSRKKTDAGYADEHMSYVTAFEIAENLAAEQGDVLTAEEFGELVKDDPRIVPNLLKRTKAAKTQPHKAFVATPPGDGGMQSGVAARWMTNYNRDAQIAGVEDNPGLQMKAGYIRDALDFDNMNDDDSGFGEEIVINPDEE